MGTLITWAITVVLFIAAAIVVAIAGAIADILGLLLGIVLYLAATAVGFYFYYLDGETGGHPGKRLTGLKTVNAETGQTIGGGMGILRMLAHIVDNIICYIGYLFPLWDEKRQTIADKLVSTVVVADQPKMAFGPDVFKP